LPAVNPSDPRPLINRFAAAAALLLLAAAAVVSLVLAVRNFRLGLPVAVCAAAAVLVAWRSLAREGSARVLGLVAALIFLAVATVLVAVNGLVLEAVLIGTLVLLSVVAARAAFTVKAPLRRAEAPRRPALFWNPRSGGGKATSFDLAREARSRGFETVELRRGDDLGQLVEEAIGRGVDALAMAGGDGSQATVARLAAENELPYACIPAGTRNHLALDLGVDRDDVIGALDAFVDGGERRVDLAEVNGRVFVNNVSLGVYADAVQRPGYREAKLRTLLTAFGEGPGSQVALRWKGPGDEEQEGVAPAVLVSNNPYRLGRAIGSGTRPRLDAGLLGIVAFPGGRERRGRGWQQWTAPRFEVRAAQPVNAGIDGEAAVLHPPLRFLIRRRALRVRVARSHPGRSPSSAMPPHATAMLGALARTAFGARSP
jgi:diacylglycerol kinase family enzyme